MSNDPIHNETMRNHRGQESTSSAEQISQSQKSNGYWNPSGQQPGESSDHYLHRINSW